MRNALTTRSTMLSKGDEGHPKLVAEFVAMGARMVSTGTDIQFLLAAASAKAREVKALGLDIPATILARAHGD
jgi:hypothetical protein